MTADAGRTIRRLVAASIAALVLVLSAFFGGVALSAQQAPPSTLSVEAGFARDMQVHHQQAVEMSLMVRDSSTDPAIRQLAYDIATTQAQQAGQMHGWLSVWGLPQAPAEPAMTWMSRPTRHGSAHGHQPGAAAELGAAMPGMATSAQLSALRDAEGADSERIYLRLMIDHHRGGVEMAEAALERTEEPVVLSLARAIVRSQKVEIVALQELLAGR